MTALAIVLAVFLLAMAGLLRTRHVGRWFFAYARDSVSGRHRVPSPPFDLLVCVADHFEPLWAGASLAVAGRRVEAWMHRFPALASRHRDSDGRPPVHTFFFPAEQYRPEWIDSLGELCRAGLGEVDVHIHHGHDTADSLRLKLTEFRDRLAAHGLLSAEAGGPPRYGFIHGDWALANSGPGPETCGVDDELAVLKDTGCYADLTFPSAPSPTQIGVVNRLWLVDPCACGRRPHARGVEARVGIDPGNLFMLIMGPLTPDFGHRKFGLLPRIENGDLSAGNPPHPRRLALWLRSAVAVRGRPEWVFVKLHTHGAAERNQEVLLGDPMDGLLSHLEKEAHEGGRYRLHYVSAREMFNIAKAAMDGKSGNPSDWRDYLLLPRWKGKSP